MPGYLIWLNARGLTSVGEIVTFMAEFARFTLKLFHDIVLNNSQHVDLILSSPFRHETYSMGLVDSKNLVNFYDGQVRVTAPDGSELPAALRTTLARGNRPYSLLARGG